MADSLVEPLIGATVAMMCLTTLVISVRVGVRASLRTYGLDDVLIVASWVFTMAMCIQTLVSAHAGFGRHHQDVDSVNYERFLKLTISTSSTYSYGLALAKMSFAVLYIRMLPERRLIIVNKTIVVFLCCQAIEESMIPIFQCHPIAKAWIPSMVGTCLDLPVLWWIGFAFNLCTDLILFIQPIPFLWRLQLPIIKRLGLIAMLSLGLMVCAISVIRMHSVTEMGIDDTHDLAVPIIWSEAEVSTLIICSCVPFLRKLAQRLPWYQRMFETTNHDSRLPPVETIGHARRRSPFGSKENGMGKDVFGDDSGLTGSTLTYPMSVLSRPAKASDPTNNDMAEIQRITSANMDNSTPQPDSNKDLEANAEVIQTPLKLHSPSSPISDSKSVKAP
ncbi:integral membrane protein [Colletotrichum asianum]